MFGFGTTQILVIVVLYSFVSWFTGHMASHRVAVATGQASLNPVLLEKLIGYSPIIFLVWLSFKTAWYAGIILWIVGFFGSLPIIFVQQHVGLTKRAWIISLSGIVFVPFLLFVLKTIIDR